MRKKLTVALLGATLVLAFLTYLLCPKPELKNYTPYSKAYYDANGELLRFSLAKDERYRLYESLDNIAPELVEATILYEDKDFYQHSGVDVLALVRAFWMTYVTKERRIGASTIVMQLARLRWQIQSNTLPGKFHQILRALQISRHYSKEEILESYLNLTPYGGNIEGVAAASIIYFNKKPSELSLPEALTLAVIPQNPNKRAPVTERGYKRLLEARSILFERWKEYHPEDAEKAKFFELKLNVRSAAQLPFEAPHLVNYINTQSSEWESGYINTSLNLNTQKRLEAIVKSYVESNSNIGIKNASALLVNYNTMMIEAMVGSADFFNTDIDGQVNGVDAKRSPGSTLKPFVYGLAMDQGVVHPMSLMKDSPKKFGGFTPENFDKRFMGPLSVKDALIESRNVPAVNLQARLEGESFHQFLKSAGVTGLKKEDHYGLALALGGGEVTAIELARLYAMLANKGRLKNIGYTNLVKKHPSPNEKQLLSPESSFLVLDILKNNDAPDAVSLDIPNAQKNDIPWKTGTSWAFRDAWAAGITGPYVLVVWVGNFDGSGNEAFIGRSAAGPLFFKILDAVYPSQNWQVEDAFDVPSMNLKRLDVCSNTGDLYEKHCPAKQSSWFIPGVSPIKLSNIYRQIPINPNTGKRACFHRPGVTELEVFEFWPSDFLHVYSMAGISLKTPPGYESNCSLDMTSSFGESPIITSPQASVEYVYRFSDGDGLEIPLTANVDANVKTIHWFINAAYIASSKTRDVVTWRAKPGEYDVQVVDEDGRSASKTIRVVAPQ